MNQTIAVSGTGTASAPPTLAVVDIGVEVVDSSVATARAAAATDMAAVVASLRESGVADTRISTITYTINPEYDHGAGRRFVGYRVVNTVAAQIEDIDAVGDILDAATGAGGEHVVVRALRFQHQDPAGLEAEARTHAWDDTRNKARQLAELAGVVLGRVVAISEQPHQGGAPVPLRAMAVAAAGGAPIETGELAVTVSIHAEFEID